MEKLREEVNAARGTGVGGRLHRTDMLNLRHLQNVLKESEFLQKLSQI
jgi:hypothetical protein